MIELSIFSQLSEQLQMALGDNYHTGIRRDETNKTVWRRSADGVQVDLSGWDSYNGYPRNDVGWDFLYWYFYYDEYKNIIYNFSDASHYFICEY